MPNLPEITGFDCEKVAGGGFQLEVTIAVPDSITGASMLAHIAAITDQYTQVQAQVAAGEAQASNKVIESAIKGDAVTTKPATRRAPKAPRGKKPSPKVAEVASVPSVAVETVKVAEEGTRSPDLESAPTVVPEPTAVPETTVVPEPTVATVPDGVVETCPASLVACDSFKQVLGWMIEHNYTTVDMIVAKCEQYRDQVPALQRVDADLATRTTTGLAAIEAMAAVG